VAASDGLGLEGFCPEEMRTNETHRAAFKTPALSFH